MKQEDLLGDLLREYFAGRKIIRQYVLGNNLRLDFYIPELNLAIEYNGIQHDEKNYFHKDDAAFFSSIRRDEEKLYACEQLGIELVYFDYSDKLTAELVAERLSNSGGDGIVKDSRYLNKKVEAKRRQKALRKEHYDSYKQSERYKERLRLAREQRKRK